MALGSSGKEVATAEVVEVGCSEPQDPFPQQGGDSAVQPFSSQLHDTSLVGVDVDTVAELVDVGKLGQT